VLADIDWWRVTEGQFEQPGAGDLELEEAPFDAADDNALAGEVTGAGVRVEPGVEHPGAQPRGWSSTDVPLSVPTAEFAALSIAPRTPSRRARRIDHSPPSSAESTPGPVTPRLEGLRLGLMDLSTALFEDKLAFQAADLDDPFAPCPKDLTRTHLFADSAALDEFAGYGADSPMVPLLALPALLV